MVALRALSANGALLGFPEVSLKTDQAARTSSRRPDVDGRWPMSLKATFSHQGWMRSLCRSKDEVFDRPARSGLASVRIWSWIHSPLVEMAEETWRRIAVCAGSGPHGAGDRP